MIYLDNSATTKPYPEALVTYTEVASKIWGNPSSLHSLGSQATRLLEASRRQIAELLGKSSSEIFLRLEEQKGTTGCLKELLLKKFPLANTSSFPTLSIPRLKNQPSGFRVKDLKWILRQ